MRVLLMGDSIRMGYEPHVKRILEANGRFKVVGVDSNCEHSTNILKMAHWWFYIQPRPDIIHVNCGLHDIKTISYGDRENLVPLQQYRRNLQCIIKLARRLRNSRIIIATTTPINERKANKAHRQWMDFRRFEVDIIAYNRVVRDVTDKAGVCLDDLYSVVKAANPDEMLSADGVHFTEEGYKSLARSVAACIEKVSIGVKSRKTCTPFYRVHPA